MSNTTTAIATPDDDGKKINPFEQALDIGLQATAGSEKLEATEQENTLAQQVVVFGVLMAQKGALLQNAKAAQDEIMKVEKDRMNLLIAACKTATSAGAAKRGLRGFIQAIYKAAEDKLIKDGSTVAAFPYKKDGKRKNRAPGMVVGMLKRQAIEVFGEFDDNDDRNPRKLFKYGKAA